MIARLVLAFFAFVALALPAGATGTIACESQTGAAIALTVGHVPGLAIVGAHIADGDESWSMNPEDGTGIALAQGYKGADFIRADFTDANLERFLIHLRLFVADRNGDFVMAGTLETPNGIHALVCDGME